MNPQPTQPQPARQTPPPIRSGLSGGFFNGATGGDERLNDRVFTMTEETFRSSRPKAGHWSIAWSDLMMTMFILFLSLFVYQAAHREFLVDDEIEVIGGDTAAALEIGASTGAVFPFVPIHPGPPLITAGTVRKVEPIRLQDLDLDTAFAADRDRTAGNRPSANLTADAQPYTPAQPPPTAHAEPESLSTAPAPDSAPPRQPFAGGILPSLDRTARLAAPPGRDFQMDKQLLDQLRLDDFASIDLVPDNTMRIMLTGDLLFDTGRAELSTTARDSLRKIAAVIKDSPYMINVVGHTDNIPMHSPRYETNWELSVARASRVARFLIEDMAMNANQFVVSGYGSQRPLKPNNTSTHRAVNRRVEVIVSKKLPNPVTVSLNMPSANH